MTAKKTAQELERLLVPVADERLDANRLNEARRILSNPDLWRFEQNEKWNQFLRDALQTLVEQLCERVREGKRSAFRTLWGVIGTIPSAKSAASKQTIIDTNILAKLVHAASLTEDWDNSFQRMYLEFVGPFKDVQYYIMGVVACSEGDPDRLAQFLMDIPLNQANRYLIPPSDEVVEETDSSGDDDDSSVSEAGSSTPVKKRKMFSYQDEEAHSKAWGKAWLAILKLPLSKRSLKKILQFLPSHVLNRVSKPLLFSDFFMNSYGNGGLTAILALEGLFLLITKHNLEYPQFYKQLYACISPRSISSKYRDTFFELLGKCLNNSLLPAHIVAAFSKRLLRSSLQSPPATILFVLALVSNLLRKHPEMLCLVHRDEREMEDPFDADTDDPEESRALFSSLWELSALSRHYYPPIVTLSKSLGREEELKAPLHNLSSDFVGHSYKSMFEQERKRKRKHATPVTFNEPSGLFVENDAFAVVLGSVGK